MFGLIEKKQLPNNSYMDTLTTHSHFSSLEDHFIIYNIRTCDYYFLPH